MNKRLMLGFYGDDFTGSTDAMEVLANAGWKTVLFLHPPDPQTLAEHFPDVQCIGIAGVSRSLNDEQLASELSPVFNVFQQYQPKFIHYKVCSTFDSSPEIGNIGRVIEIAKTYDAELRTIPILVGSPALKRYTVFGNHFANVMGSIYRLDRHPVMSKHPITPMNEADLRQHLQKQSSSFVELMSVLELQDGAEHAWESFDNKMSGRPDAVLFDCLDEGHIKTIGELFWREAETIQQPLFVIGSSGVEHALASAWSAHAEQKAGTVSFISPGAAEPLLIVSGSCSAVTNRQIEVAMASGFAGIKLEVQPILASVEVKPLVESVIAEACKLIAAGKSVVIFTAQGLNDPTIQDVKSNLNESGKSAANTGEKLGSVLGHIAKEVVQRTKIRRVAVAGGDTSGFATRELGVSALEMLYPTAPGAPLCKCHSENPEIHGLELALKGGQLGQEDYFCRIRSGT